MGSGRNFFDHIEEMLVANALNTQSDKAANVVAAAARDYAQLLFKAVNDQSLVSDKDLSDLRLKSQFKGICTAMALYAALMSPSASEEQLRKSLDAMREDALEAAKLFAKAMQDYREQAAKSYKGAFSSERMM